MSPSLSLIIAVHERPHFLRRIFLSLLRQSFTDFEIIIGDDGSGPAIAEVIAEFSPKFLHPIVHVRQENRGFRKTIIINNAVRQARGAYLVFIDGDCILHRHFLKEHFKRKHKGFALSGRRVMLDEPITETLTDEHVGSGSFEAVSFWRNHVGGEEHRGRYLPFLSTLETALRPGKRYWIFGSNFSLHRSDFESVNGYDEDIVGRGMEDINLSQRLQLHGVKVQSVSRAAIQYHMFHTSDPVPHSAEDQKRMSNPETPWAVNGLVKETR